MTNSRFFAKLVVALLCVVGVSLTSCRHQEETPSVEYPKVNLDSKPGDDFYAYANAEWFRSLEGVNSQRTYGFLYDIAGEVNDKVQEVKATMSEIQAVERAGANRDKNLEASLALAEEIVKDLLSGAETKEDAYVTFGKAIRMGVSSIATVHVGICREDNTIGFYFVPPMADMVSLTGVHSADKPSDHVLSKRLSRYVQGTRSGKTPIDYVLEGIGLDSKYYLTNDISEEMIAALEEVDRVDLLKNIGEALLMHLYCYCSDEYAYQCSGGEVNSVKDYVNQTWESDLGYHISYNFAQAYPTDSAEPTFSALGDELIATFRTRLENNQWLSPTTKQAAIEKLDYMGKYYGTPKKWPVTEKMQLKGELLIADMMTIKDNRIDIIGSLLGKSLKEYLPIYYMYFNPIESIYTYTANAFYDAAVNGFYMLPAYMIEPAYSATMEECKLYAIWGTVLGHEITHGFDQGGATYDKNGEKNNWWTESDAAKFAELNALRIENVSSYEILPGMKANGEKTVQEDVADLGGFNIAYDLWVKKLKERGIEGEELKELKRQFFLNFATVFSVKMPIQDMIELAENDTHSPGHIRINSVVQHIDDWYELFGVTEGDALYLAPEDRITIW